MPRNPNIVLIVTDQQRPDSLGCYGNVFTQTPNLDRFAEEGAVFENAFTVYPLCTPSRASLWTGVYPHRCGVTDVVSGVADAFAWGEVNVTLFSAMKESGYYQGYIGKWHLGSETPQGMDDWRAFNSGGGHWVDGVQSFQGGEYIPERQTAGFLEMIDQAAARGEPFFLVQSYYPPHEPYTVPDKYMEMYRGKGVFRPGYYAAVTAIDDYVGQILDRLDRHGLSDDTIVLFLSDHGEHFNYYAQHNKSTCHDESIAIPLMVRWPGQIAPGQRFSQMVGVQDIVPTLLEASGAQISDQLDGKSLLPLMRGDGTFDRERFYIQNIQDFRSIGDWVQAFAMGPYLPGTRDHFSSFREWDRQRGLREDGWKISLSEHGQHLMYNLTNDPEEEINIFGAPRSDFQNQLTHMPDQTPTMLRLVRALLEEAEALGDGFGVLLAKKVLAELGAAQE